MHIISKKIKGRLSTIMGFIPDKEYISLVYFIKTKRLLNIKNPVTFNEKIQYKKIYDHNPIYTTLVDKYRVREYVKERIGDKYLIPLLGVWEDADVIDFDSLPNEFVLKCNHDSGTIIICDDKASLDYDLCRIKLNDCLKANYYYRSREWAYKDVKPCVIAEKLIRDDEGALKDYKFFCFGGKVHYIQVDFDRQTNHTRKIYTKSWEPLDVRIEYPVSGHDAERPRNLDEMIWVAEKLSQGLSDARIDLYSITSEGANFIYFGEITLYHGSGLERMVPESFNKIMGELIKRP